MAKAEKVAKLDREEYDQALTELQVELNQLQIRP